MTDRKKSVVQFAAETKSVEAVVVIPNRPVVSKATDGDKTDAMVPPLRRSQSDGEMYQRTSSISAASALTTRTNWIKLVEHLKMKQRKKKSERERSFIDAINKSKAKRKIGRCNKFKIFARKASCLFTGPMFYRHRSIVIIFLEVFVPVFLFLFVSWAFTSGISWKKAYGERKATDALIGKKSGADFNSIPTDEDLLFNKFREKYVDRNGRLYIAYSPANEFTNGIMKQVIENLGVDNTTNPVNPNNPHSSVGAAGVDDPLEVLELCLLHRIDRKAHKDPIGIEFTLGDIDPITSLPHTFKYVIRTFDKSISQTNENQPWIQPPKLSGSYFPPYVESGFSALQLAIQKAFLTKVYTTLIEISDMELLNITDPLLYKHKIEARATSPDDPAFPAMVFKLLFTPNHFDKSVRQLISVTICLILCFSYTGLSYFIVRQVVIEGQSGIKDFLSLHHMAKYLHWIVYFFHSLVFRTVTAAGIAGTLYIDYGHGAIFTHSNPAIIYIIIFLHLMSLSSFNFFIATLLSSVTFSGILSVNICFFSFVFPYCLLKAGLMSEIVNIILSLMFPNWALWNAIMEIVDYECDDVGVNWANLKVLTNNKVQLTYLQCIFIFVGGNIVYFLLAMLRDIAFNKKRTSTFSWYGCFQAITRRRQHAMDRLSRLTKSVIAVTPAPAIDSEQEDDFPTPLVYERPELSSQSLAKIRNVSKTYGEYKLVLDNVNLDVVNNELLVILGPADSGKSTLLQCMAGIVKPTTGNIRISGIDLRSKKSKAREFIGYCPQDAVLFNVLSVQEHLVLCYKLRGLSTKEAKTYTDGLMQLLRIVDVKKFTPGALTIDERRKLSIALCLVDRPSMILLDEPTNGMEPLTRHEIWTILKGLKADGHTIVMTTSMMDEAEFLADRVALLSHGKLICYGTSKFLKERYDTGYYLRIIPNPAKFSLEAFQLFASKWFKETLREAPEKTMFDQRNFLLMLPPQDKGYADFFDALEESKENLGVLAYGAQTVGLCDIFIKMSEAVSVGKNPPDIYIRKSTVGEERSVFWGEIPNINDENIQTPSQKIQFRALLHKLWLFGVGGNYILFWEIFLPLLLIWITIWHSHVFVVPPPTPVEREFVLSKFPLAKVIFRETGIVHDTMNWEKTLVEILGDRGEELKLNSRLEDVIRKDMKEDRAKSQYSIEKRMIAVELRSVSTQPPSQEFWAYFASGSLHSPPLVHSILGNLFLRAITKKFEAPGIPYTMIVANTPFPTVYESDFDLRCGITCLMFGLVISFCIGFFISLLMTFPLLERVTGMKQLQFMTGLYPFIYWLSYYVYHLLVTLTLSLLVTIIFILDSESIYSAPATFGTLLLIVVLFLSWSGPPWVYFLTTLVPISMDGPLMGYIIHLLFAFIPTLILETGFSDNDDGFTIFLRYFFHLYPPHTLTSAIYIFFEIVSKRSVCASLPSALHKMCSLDNRHRDQKRYAVDMKQIFDYMVQHDTNLAKCCEKICGPSNSCSHMTPFFSPISERWDQPKLLICVIAFILQGIIYWNLLMLLESRPISGRWHNLVRKFLKTRVNPEAVKLPPDIALEKAAVEKIMETEKCPEGTLMICQDLTKSSIEQMIISEVNIQLKEGDIVGLLGGTGCGKSVLIKMLAGEIVPTRGIVIIEDLNLHKNRKKFLRHISYCPQNDPLFDTFTGNQLMELVGKLRGLPKTDLQIHAKKWLQLLGLAEAAKDKCSSYSKNMRRRLSTAMALMGGNLIILLDEPTRGLDPVAKLRFWSVIRELASRGYGIIFTSASVMECEANATKVLVLSEGNVQCIGQPEQLRHRFSKGFTFLLRLRYDLLTPIEIVSTTVGRISELKNTVLKKFKHAILRDEQGNLLLYFISATGNLTWGKIFAISEEIKQEHPQTVESYFISQSTLDDVFVLLTNRYKDMDLPRNMRSSFPGEITQEEAEVQALEEATKLKAFD